MKKENLKSIHLVLFTCFLLVYSCNKKDFASKSLGTRTEELSSKSTDPSAFSDSGNLNKYGGKRPPILPTNSKEKPLTTKPAKNNGSSPDITSTTTTANSCGSFPNGTYYGDGFYRYPDYALNFSNTPKGSIISISVNAHDIPNRFTVYDVNYNYVAYTGWMGYADYSGPWGSSLNATQPQTLSFATGTTSSYFLVVETSTLDYSDAWDAVVVCNTPAPPSFSFNQLAIDHNNALDYIHLNYSSGGPYNFQAIYNGLVSYGNANGKPLPNLSYQQLFNIKSQVTDINSLLIVMQNQYNAFTNNEKNELLTLYQNLSVTASDDQAQLVLNNFNTHINQTSYSSYEKVRLKGVSSMLFTIGDFWSSTENFMAAPGETLTWQQRASNATSFNLNLFPEENQSWSIAAISARGPNVESFSENLFYRRCRFWCVLCVAFNDAIMAAAMSGTTPAGAAIAAAAWSVMARCCICSRCGTAGCWND